ncbi:MAG: helix-turn-helix domain-containing protein [Chitinophagaceae bacterium]
MLLKKFAPAPGLREYVHYYRIVHFRFDAKQQQVKFFPPGPQFCLAFYPFGQERICKPDGSFLLNAPQVLLSGQQLEASIRHLTGNHFLTVQIFFTPAGLYRLTGISPHLLINTFTDAEAIFGSQIRSVNEQLAAAASYTDMIYVLDSFAEQIKNKSTGIKAAHFVDKAAGMILQDHTISIDRLAQTAFASTRQFQRIFKDRIGISPKLFERIVRFEKTYLYKLQNPGLRWTDIAYACQYSNYQHMAAEYRQLTGLSPQAYELRERQSPEQLLGIATTDHQSIE